MLQDIIAKYPDDEFLQYRWRENPGSFEREYWKNHFEFEFFKYSMDRKQVTLDFGCGLGVMTDMLRQDGFPIFGYDDSEGSIAVARYLSPDTTFYNLFPERTDYTQVWMCHVLEHIPTSQWPEVFSSFKQPVVILISVPLGMAYDDGYGYHVNHWYHESELASALSEVSKFRRVTYDLTHSVLRAQVST